MALPPVVPMETVSGRYLVFAGQDMINRTLATTGAWEPWTVDLAQALLAAPEPQLGTIVDAGANLGAVAIALARRLPAGYTLHCFEMQRIVYYQLCGNIVINGFENIHAHNVALGAADETMDIPRPDYAADANIGAVSADRTVRALRRTVATDQDGAAVESGLFRRLDSFGLRDVRLIKIDVEGMERDVLTGGAETLALSGYPPLILEIWKPGTVDGLTARTGALLAHLAALGYRCDVMGSACIAQHTSRPGLKVEWDAGAGTFRTAPNRS